MYSKLKSKIQLFHIKNPNSKLVQFKHKEWINVCTNFNYNVITNTMYFIPYMAKP